MRRLAAGAIGIAALLTAGTARPAGEPGGPIALAWAGLPGCPGEHEVRAEIERVLGGPPDPASRRSLRAEARVSRALEKNGFHVHIVTDLGGVTGERDLDGPTCAAVADAAAVIVALTFDPEALSRRAEAAAQRPVPADLPPVPAPPPPRVLVLAIAPSLLPLPLPDTAMPPPAPAWSPSVASPADDRAPPKTQRPVFALGAVGAASIGALPKVGGGIGGRAGILVGRFRADLSATYWPEETATLPGRPTAGGQIHLIAGDASACWALLRAPVEVLPCLGLEVGSMSAVGFGVRADSSGSAPWVAPVAEGVAALPFGKRFAARVDLGVLVPAVHRPFVLSGAGTVYTAGPVVGRAAVGLEVRL